ncbi:DnaJ C-terminal domain-containing protein [Vibrio sp. HN007]|uniref:DnaJ C-terminal domain-containing protein n=1 Tax=Vibrio iocasae TaxID=3098914 RepID=UPI0035D4114F
MEFKDYYQIMGVSRDATKDEIKRAYRKLGRKYHPDVSKEADAEAHFKEVKEAYEVLKDPEKRAAYDQLGENWKEGQRFQRPPDWDQGFDFRGGGFTNANSADFSDFFENLFGRGGFNQRAQRGFNARGQDSHAKVTIDLEDTYNGTTRTLTLRQTEIGAGGNLQPKERVLNIRVPKGVLQGQSIRLAGQGEKGLADGKSGDLYLEVELRPHPIYKVEGKDVYVDLPVAPWEVALGAKVKANTPTGIVDLTIPSGSVGGRKMRLKGRGIPSKIPGDLYVVLQVILPRADTEEAKKAYADFKQAVDFNPREGFGG